jgi:hypothetical protein
MPGMMKMSLRINSVRLVCDEKVISASLVCGASMPEGVSPVVPPVELTGERAPYGAIRRVADPWRVALGNCMIG